MPKWLEIKATVWGRSWCNIETAYPSTVYSNKGGVAVESPIGDDVVEPIVGLEGVEARPKAGAKLVGKDGELTSRGGSVDRRSDIRSLITWFCSTTSWDSSRT